MGKPVKTKRKFFKGKYYKLVSNDGYSLAFITYQAGQELGIQVITPSTSYVDIPIDQIEVSSNKITFKVNTTILKITGSIDILDQITPSKDVMGILRHLPLQCKHNLYILLGHINGMISISNKVISFDNGLIYVEGDEGINFPSQYLWLNGVSNTDSFTVSIAKIPFFPKPFRGHFAYLCFNNKQYRFASYNFSKIKRLTTTDITIKKGSYLLEISFPEYIPSAHPLKAPIEGKMNDIIKEAVKTTSSVTLYKHHKKIFEDTFVNSSMERVKI